MQIANEVKFRKKRIMSCIGDDVLDISSTAKTEVITNSQRAKAGIIEFKKI